MKKDITVELRQKAALNGILLYVISTVFVAYLIFSRLEELSTWVALLWIVLLFASTNASINSFRKEAGREFFYYYSIAKPQAIILSKILFNAILQFVIAALTLLLFSVLLGNPVENMSLFSVVLFLGSLGISTILTLSSAIASKTKNNATLTAILSFPIMLPTLLTAIKASMLCGLGFSWEDCQVFIVTLGLLNIVIVMLSFILFPYLWRS
ncbi:heme exporter protein CcmB [Vicingaceae bacterium]|nr:heme exporter protein CcmB [Vicingaceae bacterium]MDB4061991.1 heme exporter protein CcmB [Vicingaceae bacterium]MDC1452103.1 heme exporter protein CcmB [Vicingaceae bacterium]